MSPPRRGVVVIGIGNIIRSDDGLGVHAIQRLRDRGRHAHGIELIEGGTAGLLLLPLLTGAQRVIIIDAISTGEAPGTLVRLPNADGAFGTGITAHELGLADLLAAARFSGVWPDELVLHGAAPGSTEFGTELTPPVAAALDGLLDAVEAELRGWRVAPAALPVRNGPLAGERLTPRSV